MISLDAITKLLTDFFANPVDIIIFRLFLVFGWAIFVWLLLFLGIYFYVEYRQEKYKKDWNWVLLAIDIPANNEQSPKAVEQLFAHLAGALNEPDIAEKYRGGFVQRWFSFEIVSIDGYIQFLVRTEESLRDLVEAAMYAQYPGAEIIEVEEIPTSEKLLKLKVSFGEEERQILSGIKNYFDDPQELLGKKLPFVTNLKPRKMMGFESEGMILAVNDTENFSLLEISSKIKNGSPIS